MKDKELLQEALEFLRKAVLKLDQHPTNIEVEAVREKLHNQMYALVTLIGE